MANLHIKILGAECNKCNTLLLRVQKIVSEHQLEAVVEKITDVQAIINHNIYTTPALLINNQVVSKGSLLSEKQIIEKNKFIFGE
ncbi:MAG: thioredoxin family protein [Bacteroidetes bacterium]|nr:thioredoxin family protein [Bacteroidota bacterium]